MNIFVVLTLIFMVLKLCHQIDWSWWFVLSPYILYSIMYAWVYIWWQTRSQNQKIVYMIKRGRSINRL